jgi:hypothetical protein
MLRKVGCWSATLMLLMLVLGPRSAQAGPFLGDWSWCWSPQSKDCSPSLYCPLHWWTPTLYRAHAWFCPANLDSYPPGLPVQPTFVFQRYPCQSTPPAPSPPYADPAAFYGIPIVPAPEETKEKPAGERAAESAREE